MTEQAAMACDGNRIWYMSENLACSIQEIMQCLVLIQKMISEQTAYEIGERSSWSVE